MIDKFVIKIAKWVLPMMLLSVFLTAFLQSESIATTLEIKSTDIQGSVMVELVNESHHQGSEYEEEMMGGTGHMGGMEWKWMMDGDGHFMDRMDEMMGSHGYMMYPIIGVIVFLMAAVGVMALVFSFIFAALLIFIVIKILQAMVDGVNTETEKADVIGVNVYYLYLASFLLPILSLAGVIVSYIYQGKASDWMKTHYRFQIRTFWLWILYCTVSSILTVVIIGFVGYAFIFVWVIVRSVQGIKAFNKKEPIAKPTTWLWN